MGQKVNPIAFRLGSPKIGVDWVSRWFSSKKDYPNLWQEDYQLRRFLEDKLRSAGLAAVEIERFHRKMKITLVVTRPGLVIGRGGKGLEELKRQLVAMIKTISQPGKNLELEVEEYKTPDLSAKVVAERIASQLLRRMPYRRVVNQAMDRIMAAGARGVKIILKGRINGIEIARQEKFYRGQVSLNTLRSQVDYAQRPILTRSGYIGLKVYINRGER